MLLSGKDNRFYGADTYAKLASTLQVPICFGMRNIHFTVYTVP